MEISEQQNRLLQSIIDIAVESWRFKKVFERAMSKLDAGDNARYHNQYAFFAKKVESALNKAGLRIVNIEGQKFDVGMAASPLNMNDFDSEDLLYVEQMIEPIIMFDKTVIRSGSVIVRGVDK